MKTEEQLRRFHELSPAKRALLMQTLQKEASQSKAAARIGRRPPGPAPLSYAQQRLWFIDQLDQGNIAYNEPMVVRITGSLDEAVLARCMGEVIRRHEVLRTTFHAVDGLPVARIASEAVPTLPLTDLRSVPGGERERQAELLAVELIRKPFNLRESCLPRAALLKLDDTEHVLVMAIHHIVSDGWSMGVLVREIATLYESLRAGQQAVLPDLTISYADFAYWQREWLSGERLEAQRDYWKQTLGDAPTVLELPTDYPRPPIQTFRGASTSFTLSSDITDAVHALAQQSEATVFITLLAAWTAFLHRYTGQDDLIVGSPIANRNRRETEPLIGFFVNVLPLRARFGRNMTFCCLLDQLRESTLGAQAHQDLPFEMLLDGLNLERDMSRNALCQATFSLQNAPFPTLRLPGLTFAPCEFDLGTAKFDLQLDVREIDRGLLGTLTYNTDLFAPDTAEGIATHFRVLLEGALAAPKCRVAALPLLTSEQRHQMLTVWNETTTDFPAACCIQQLFEELAERTPDRVAVTFDEKDTTYAELNAQANRLAHHLRGLGVGPDTPVGICMARSTAMIAGILGILKAGGAYVPLDPDYPTDRLAFMIADTRAQVLLADANLASRLPVTSATVICPDDADTAAALRGIIPVRGGPAALAANSAPRRYPTPGRSQPDNLAVIIYTSGSTGVPKGIQISHRAVIRLVRNTNHIQIQPSDTVSQAASASFDAATFEIWGALLSGARLVVVPKDVYLHPSEFSALIIRQKITTLFLTTAYFNEFARHAPEALNIKHVLFGGEAADPAAARIVLEHGKPEHLVHYYGPAETTTFATFHEIECVPDGALTVPIGRPVANTSVYVLDRELQPVPVGAIGELFAGGVGVARGYVNRPDLTAERFIPDPFGEQPAGRLYRTGDLVRMRTDGALDFVGRRDEQVKIRGFRIELGEIETVLAEHESVASTVVVMREDGGAKKLVAYVVPKQDEPTLSANLRAFVKDRLPDYMVPSTFVVVDAFPITPNGKVDRKALPAPRVEAGSGFAPPRTTVEEMLAAIWAGVLGLERVGIHDNFFEVGGDSILSIQIVSRANRAGIALTPRMIFENQTIAEQAAVAGALAAAAAAADQGLVSGPAPLTPIQRWFFEQDLADPHHFNQAVSLETDSALNVDLLRQAFLRLIEHHDALRMSFQSTDGGWLQTNAGTEAGADEYVRIVDLSQYNNAEDRQTTVDAQIEQAQSGFDLRGPLIKMLAFTSGSGPARLLIVAHHLVIDGVSWRILLEDLQLAYSQLLEGAPVTLPAKTTSFQRWSELLGAHAQSSEIAKQEQYWQAIPWANAGTLPVDFTSVNPAHVNTVASAQTITVALSVEETRALLKDTGRAYHTQINDLLLAALTPVLCRWTRQSSGAVGARLDDASVARMPERKRTGALPHSGAEAVAIALEGHGRQVFDDVDNSRTIGWFTSSFPVLLTAGQDASLGGLLVSTKEQLRSIPDDGVSYGLLRYLADDGAAPEGDHRIPQPGRRRHVSQSRSMAQEFELREPQVSFNYLGQFDQTLPAGSIFRLTGNVGPTQSPRNRRSRLLEIDAAIIGGQLRINWAYSDRIHVDTTIRTLADGYLRELRVLIAHCQSRDTAVSTPSDFPDAALDFEQLGRVVDTLGGAEPEAIYPLSPMQQGLLFHTLYSRQSPLGAESGEYVVQSLFDVKGDLDVPAFEDAWRQVVDQHAILRTAFLWEGLPAPIQVVARHVELPVRRLDWTGLAADEHERRFAELLASDRAEGFEVSSAPLLRLTLMHKAPEHRWLLWTHHHILLDGWCLGLLFREVMSRYQARIHGDEFHAAGPRAYRDYIRWLRKQDAARAERYWRTVLEGMTIPTPLPAARRASAFPHPEDDRSPAGTEQHGRQSTVISADIAERLLRLAQQHQVTLNTLAQGAWALLLARYSRQDDVLFGSVVSGRPPSLDGVDTMMGLFINSLPVRVRVPEQEPVMSWLRGLQYEQAERLDYEHVPLVSIQGWSDIPRDLPLFESLLVFENYPIDRTLTNNAAAPDGLRIAMVDVWEYSHYPLMMLIAPGKSIHIRCTYQQSRYADESIGLVIAAYEQILRDIAAYPDRQVGAFGLTEALSARSTVDRERAREQALVVAATFTAEPVEEPLQFWMDELGLPSRVEFAPYNQVFQQLLDPTSGMAGNEYGVNILLIRLEDWLDAERNAGDFVVSLTSAFERSSMPYLVCLCPPSPALPVEVQERLAAIEDRMAREVAEIVGVSITTSADLLRDYPDLDYGDPYAELLGHVPYTSGLYAALATAIARRIYERRADEPRFDWDQVTPDDVLARIRRRKSTRGTGEFVAPRNETEAALAGAWCDVLGIERVGLHDNFFALGGHSLQAVRIASRVRELFGVELLLRELFEAPTIAALADCIAAAVGRTGQTGQTRIGHRPAGATPLSYAQQRLWFINKLDPQSAAFNVCAPMRLTGALDASALERSLNAVICRHESLRTTFPTVDGEPTQEIADSLVMPMPVTDLSQLPDDDRLRLAEDLIHEEVVRPFDLAVGPLLRARLLRLGDAEHILVLAMHHIISDGWSMGLFVRETAELYRAFAAALNVAQASLAIDPARSVALPDLSIQYGDFAYWERERLSAETLAAERRYWKRTLDGAPESIDLPTDNPARRDSDLMETLAHPASGEEARNEQGWVQGVGNACDTTTLRIPQTIVDALQSLCRRHETTLFTGLLAALDMLLYRWTRQDDLVVGTVVAGRNRAELEPLIGCFMNFLPLRATIGGDMTGEDLLDLVKANAADAFAHQEFPFEKVVEAVNPAREHARNPIYNIALLLQNFPIPPVISDEVTARYLPIHSDTALLDLRFVAMETPDGLQIDCEYNSGLFRPATIDGLLASYQGIIDQLSAHPGTLLDALTIREDLAAQAAAARERARPRSLVLAATFTAEPIEEPLSFWMDELALPTQIEFAPYNQVFQQLLDPASAMAANEYGANILLVRLQDWPDAERGAVDFIASLRSASARSAVPYLVCLCPPSPTLAAKDQERLAAIEDTIALAIGNIAGTAITTSADLLRGYPAQDYSDPYADELGHIPYTGSLYTALATTIARRIYERRAGEPRFDWTQATPDNVLARMRRRKSAHTECEFVGPRSEVEAAIASAWCDVLGIERVGVYDNFFGVGGNSLQATRVLSRIRDLFGVELPLRDLFESPTIAALADCVLAATGLTIPTRIARRPAGTTPLSYAQQRLWFINKLDPESAAFNVSAPMRLSGILDAAALERSLNEVVCRHESLRTTFPAVDGAPTLQIADSLILPMLQTDLSHLPEDDRLLWAENLIHEEVAEPFDLATGPLIRCRLLRLGDTEHILVLAIHHIISDGWSMGVFVRETAELYRAFAAGRPAAMSDLSIQYADFAYWQHERLSADVLAAEQEYWIQTLEGAPEGIDLPIDAPCIPNSLPFREGAGVGNAGDTTTVLIPRPIVDSLQSLCRLHETTLFTGLLAALDLLLYRWTSQEDLVVGTVIAGRNRAELEPLIGCFMNFLPLRATIGGDMTGEDLLDHVKANAADAFAHQEFPFEKIVEAVNPGRDHGRNPIYNVALLLQNFPIPPVISDEVTAQYVPIRSDTALLDLRIVAMQTPEGLQIDCEYNSGLFRPATIDGLLASYQGIIEQLSAHPGTLLDALTIREDLAIQAAGARERARPRSLVLAATFTAEPIEEPLSFWMDELALPTQIEFAPYNQVFQQLLDPASTMAANEYGANILLVRLQDWPDAERGAADFIASLRPASARSAVPFLVCLCPPSPTLAGKDLERLAGVEDRIARELAKIDNVTVATSDHLLRAYPARDYSDPYADELGNIPYTNAFYISLATAIARRIYEWRDGASPLNWDRVHPDDVTERMRRRKPHTSAGSAAFVAPRNDTEAALAGAWYDVLGTRQVGVHDNFFALGGHSLQATQVLSRVRDLFGVELPLRDLFESPTIAALADCVLTAVGNGQAGSTRIGRHPAGLTPLSHAQQRLWFINKLDPQSSAFNVSAPMRLTGILDADALERSLNEVICRHESLRTTFPAVDGAPTLQIADTLVLSMPVTDLSHLPEDDRLRRAEVLTHEEVARPFDLESGPLLRCGLLRLDDTEYILVLAMHHIISDGWSMGVFVRETAELYRSFAAGQSAELSDLPIQYADFAYWQHEQLSADMLAAEQEYWIRTLEGAPEGIAIPTDTSSHKISLPFREGAGVGDSLPFREGPGVGNAGDTTTVRIPQTIVDALQSLCRRHQTTLFTGLLAALDLLLYRWTSQPDLVVGTVVAGRNRAELEPLIGCFMNFLPLRAKLAGDMAGSDLLDLVKANAADAFAHQEFPFDKVVEAVNPDRVHGRNPIYNVALLLQNFPIPPVMSDDVTAQYVPIRSDTALLDLRFVAMETPDGLRIDCEYNSGLCRPATIDALLASYHGIIEQLSARPETILDALTIREDLSAQAAAAHERARPQSLILAATFTAEPIDEPLSFWMCELGLPTQIEFAPYNQVFQQLLDPASAMATNEYGANILLVRLQDWPDAERNAVDFIASLGSALARSSVPYLVCLCPPCPTLAVQDQEQLVAIEGRIARAIADASPLSTLPSTEREAIGAWVVTSSELLRSYQIRDYSDQYADEIGHIPYTGAFYIALATAIARRLCEQREGEPPLDWDQVNLGDIAARMRRRKPAHSAVPSVFVAPRNEMEATLAAAWCDVLAIEQVGIHDNFFALGGHSLLAVRAVALANQRGVHVTLQQMFQSPTIADLAAAEGAAKLVEAEQEPIAGPLPLVPFAKWVVYGHHLGVMNDTPADTDPLYIEGALRALINHHDALRLRLRWRGRNWDKREFEMFMVPPEDTVPFSFHDLSGMTDAEQEASINRTHEDLRQIIDLENGPNSYIALFGLGPDKPARLLMIITHLVYDGYSMKIISDDFGLAYMQQVRGEQIRLPAKTSSFRQWVERMHQHIASDVGRHDKNYWLALPWRTATPLPEDYPTGADVYDSVRNVTLMLEADETAILDDKLPAALDAASVMEIGLAAAALAFSRWRKSMPLSVCLIVHGRQPIFDDIDLTRTVGFASSNHPLLIDINPDASVNDALRYVQRLLRDVPNGGLSFSWLMEFGDAEPHDDCVIPPAMNVVFNYRGIHASGGSTKVVPTVLTEELDAVAVQQNDIAYVFPDLNPGSPYQVILHFIETDRRWLSHRFDILINGSPVNCHYSIFDAAGGYDKPVKLRLNAVANDEGKICVAFAARPQASAKICALEIVAQGGLPVYRINAGGPAISGAESEWTADAHFSGGTTSSSAYGLADPATESAGASTSSRIYETCRMAYAADDRRQVPLELNTRTVDGRFEMLCEYSNNRFRRETIEDLVGKFRDALRDFIAKAQ